ncbi:MAG: ABC transporter ATP-binding protein [Corynebacteriales bacterium]|nr:ABC transporter ATP-binding protein [Mycobacteriales bacterium]
MPSNDIRAVDAAREAKVAAARDLSDVSHEPGVVKPDAILVVDGVRRQFGGLVAVDVDHLEFPRGCITALIGPNGAGKTTLFNLLTGFDRPQDGDWEFRPTADTAKKMRNVPAYRVARAGMVRTFQLTKALSKMTVLDNMKLAATRQQGERIWPSLLPFLWRAQDQAIEARAMELLARFKLDTKAQEYAGTLSGGQRKLLEMARALMTEPTIVMLDEPMAGVNPALTQSLLEHVKALRSDGMSVIFVEHDMDVVRDISDWVVVMAQGGVIAEGPPDVVSANPHVIDAYLGARHDEALPEVELGAPLADDAEAVREEIAAEIHETEKEAGQ